MILNIFLFQNNLIQGSVDSGGVNYLRRDLKEFGKNCFFIPRANFKVADWSNCTVDGKNLGDDRGWNFKYLARISYLIQLPEMPEFIQNYRG